MLPGLIQLLFVLLSPWLFLSLGRIVVAAAQWTAAELNLSVRFAADDRTAAAADDSSHPSPWLAAREWYWLLPLGLGFFLLLVFIAKSLGAPWSLAVIPPIAAAAFGRRDFTADMRALAGARITFNFGLWLTAILPLGISLFTSKGGIYTMWVNNYGDLTFHLGQISSFVWGGNFPPEYPIFPGERLTYPFMVNLWSAAMMWINPSWQALALIFLYQWVCAWLIVYRALDGDRRPLLPWAVLFGGGTYGYLFGVLTAAPGSEAAAKWAHQYIDSGYPWTPFLTTIWVTQRPTLLGLCFLLPAVKLYHDLRFRADGAALAAARADDPTRFNIGLAAAGLLCAFGVMFHTHFALVAVLYLWLSLAAFVACRLRGFSLRGGIRQAGNREASQAFVDLMVFTCCLLPAIGFLPWVLGKAGIIRAAWGWMPWPQAPDMSPYDSLFNSALMWLHNAPVWLFVILLLAIVRRSVMAAVILLVLFALGNLTQFAVWEWDQSKFFFALYLITLSLIAAGPQDGRRDFKPLWNAALLLLIIPGLFECGRSWVEFRESEVYSPLDVSRAQAIREVTEPEAVILAAPRHNSLVTLTGRRLFCGFDGTLHSHGLDYRARAETLNHPATLLDCAAKPNAAFPCPQYLLWSQFEAERWGPQPIGSERELAPMLDRFFYKITPAAAQPSIRRQ